MLIYSMSLLLDPDPDLHSQYFSPDPGEPYQCGSGSTTMGFLYLMAVCMMCEGGGKEWPERGAGSLGSKGGR
jgi:hypothetical protein